MVRVQTLHLGIWLDLAIDQSMRHKQRIKNIRTNFKGLARCPERFTDNLASCFLGTHLAGGMFWVLPDDYVILSPNTKEHQLNNAEVT